MKSTTVLQLFSFVLIKPNLAVGVPVGLQNNLCDHAINGQVLGIGCIFFSLWCYNFWWYIYLFFYIRHNSSREMKISFWKSIENMCYEKNKMFYKIFKNYFTINYSNYVVRNYRIIPWCKRNVSNILCTVAVTPVSGDPSLMYRNL